jgi:hypothetical protein
VVMGVMTVVVVVMMMMMVMRPRGLFWVQGG